MDAVLKEEELMARPVKQSDEKRTEQLNLRLTLAEVEAIRSEATKAGLPVAEYVRRRSLGYQVPSAAARSSDPALVSEINRIGVNVNQLTKAVHMDDHRSPFTAEWRAILSELRQVLTKVAGAYGS